MNRVILIALLCAVFVTGVIAVSIKDTCMNKDPQVVLPGWRDNRLEFGNSYSLLVFLAENGNYYFFQNTSPGWYQIPSNIENVWMCNY